jgi:DNA-binding beta-propeller fold protein YncE
MLGLSVQAVSILLAGAFVAAVAPHASQTAETAPLQLVTKIPLGKVNGRIDHMAVDLTRQRLFVAELGNDSVGIIDLKRSQLSGRIRGLKEPQGVGYGRSNDTLYVTSAGDGTVRLFRGQNLKNAGRIRLGQDADNIRVDSAGSQLFVGYGKGALAIIDARSNRKVADIALDGHPESFRLESGGSRIFVNVPDTHAIEVANRQGNKVNAHWTTGQAGENYPMALDEASRQVLVVFRKPAMLAAFSMQDGAPIAHAAVCGDADDVFVDAKRHRIYVSCGEGYLDVFEPADGGFRRIAHLTTAPGARTSLFVPELDLLFVAVRAGTAEKAAIWIYRPTP